MGLLLIGLWPLNFFPKNNVWWLKNLNGVCFHGKDIGSEFSAGGVAFTPDQLISLQQYPAQKGAFTIEIWLRPSVEPSLYRTRIVAFINDFENEVLFVDQWKSHLIVFRLLSVHHGQEKYRKIGVGDALIAGKTQFVSITSNGNGTSIYLEGKLVKYFPEVCLIAEKQSILGKNILIGNSPEVTNSWSGDLFGLALYDRLLTDTQIFRSFKCWTKGEQLPPHFNEGVIARYTFNEGSGIWAHSSGELDNPLLIPPNLQFKKKILIPPKISHLKTKDVIINVIGFVPFGFFLSYWLIKGRQWAHSRAFLVAIFIGMSLSLSIELLQIYLPTRDSSMADLICNIIGTILGVVFSKRYLSQPVYNS